jgi:hypothetical protein
MIDEKWVDQHAFAGESNPGLTKLEYAAIHIFSSALAGRQKLFDEIDYSDEKMDKVEAIAKLCWRYARELELDFERAEWEN